MPIHSETLAEIGPPLGITRCKIKDEIIGIPNGAMGRNFSPHPCF